MAILDWKNVQLEQKVVSEGETSGAHARKTHWTLVLADEQLRELQVALEELFGAEDARAGDPSTATELRMELPSGHMLFWKQRPLDEGSRLLVARPEIDRWVGTLALERALGTEIISRLKALGADQVFDVVSLPVSGRGWKIAPVSNLSLSFARSRT